MQPTEDQGGTRLSRLLEASNREVVVASFWSESGLPAGSARAVVRVRGQRTGVAGRPQAGDQFVREEVVADLPPGGGPFSITTRVSDVNAGEWLVSAEMVSRQDPTEASSPRATQDRTLRLDPARWSWRRWSLSSAPARPVKTTLLPLARRPGIVRGGWPGMVALGIVLAVTALTWLARREGLAVGSVLIVTTLALVVGGIGAKAWYVVLKRRERRWDGWCIQGFVLAVIVVALVAVPLVGLPLGTFLDVTTPALFVGMGVGRIGCLFAGCCGGRPTSSRFGIWSSDRRLGTRRVPTQLLEAGLAFAVAGVALSVLLRRSSAEVTGGLLFVAALSGYTLLRQGLLRFRAEGRSTSVGSRATGLVAGVVFVAAAAVLLFL